MISLVTAVDVSCSSPDTVILVPFAEDGRGFPVPREAFTLHSEFAAALLSDTDDSIVPLGCESATAPVVALYATWIARHVHITPVTAPIPIPTTTDLSDLVGSWHASFLSEHVCPELDMTQCARAVHLGQLATYLRTPAVVNLTTAFLADRIRSVISEGISPATLVQQWCLRPLPFSRSEIDNSVEWFGERCN